MGAALEIVSIRTQPLFFPYSSDWGCGKVSADNGGERECHPVMSVVL